MTMSLPIKPEVIKARNRLLCRGNVNYVHGPVHILELCFIKLKASKVNIMTASHQTPHSLTFSKAHTHLL
ncbi:hypothetical protein AYI68_g1959 [Smittium mucronatum]|uniref:Uncharacterized protein n=1 Tax=Smittium mucronatum TaxID=133383 RepID=A0A1R0H420_9FUNG|nr:hypothetical protein AYI68_g1959 [Smittium mucronatum]